MDKGLQQRVKTYLDFLLANEDGYHLGEQDDFLSILSDNLRHDIQRAIKGKVIRQHTVFQKIFTPRLIHTISMKLHEKIVCPEEILYEVKYEQMFLIIRKMNLTIHFIF